MKTIKTYALDANVSFVVADGDEKTTLKIGKKEHSLYTSDLLEFCKQFVGVPAIAIPKGYDVVEGPKRAVVNPRRTDVPDLDNRKAESSTPVKQISRDDLIKMERPLTPVDGVSFGAVDMAAMMGSKISFKKD